MVLPGSGVIWQNRGTSFNLADGAHNCLMPGRRPFHTIQPALARLTDGRVMAYGTMGGEGQPQTQAMIFTRHVFYGQDLQTAVTAPRWLLGRTWGVETTKLRIENRFDGSVLEALKVAGHDVEEVGPFEEFMGHAGALVRHGHGQDRLRPRRVDDPLGRRLSHSPQRAHHRDHRRTCAGAHRTGGPRLNSSNLTAPERESVRSTYQLVTTPVPVCRAWKTTKSLSAT